MITAVVLIIGAVLLTSRPPLGSPIHPLNSIPEKGIQPSRSDTRRRAEEDGGDELRVEHRTDTKKTTSSRSQASRRRDALDEEEDPYGLPGDESDESPDSPGLGPGLDALNDQMSDPSMPSEPDRRDTGGQGSARPSLWSAIPEEEDPIYHQPTSQPKEPDQEEDPFYQPPSAPPQPTEPDQEDGDAGASTGRVSAETPDVFTTGPLDIGNPEETETPAGKSFGLIGPGENIIDYVGERAGPASPTWENVIDYASDSNLPRLYGLRLEYQRGLDNYNALLAEYDRMNEAPPGSVNYDGLRRMREDLLRINGELTTKHARISDIIRIYDRDARPYLKDQQQLAELRALDPVVAGGDSSIAETWRSEAGQDAPPNEPGPDTPTNALHDDEEEYAATPGVTDTREVLAGGDSSIAETWRAEEAKRQEALSNALHDDEEEYAATPGVTDTREVLAGGDSSIAETWRAEEAKRQEALSNALHDDEEEYAATPGIDPSVVMSQRGYEPRTLGGQHFYVPVATPEPDLAAYAQGLHPDQSRQQDLYRKWVRDRQDAFQESGLVETVPDDYEDTGEAYYHAQRTGTSQAIPQLATSLPEDTASGERHLDPFGPVRRFHELQKRLRETSDIENPISGIPIAQQEEQKRLGQESGGLSLATPQPAATRPADTAAGEEGPQSLATADIWGNITLPDGSVFYRSGAVQPENPHAHGAGLISHPSSEEYTAIDPLLGAVPLAEYDRGIPFWGTARYWNRDSNFQRGISLAGDALFLAPFIPAGAKGLRGAGRGFSNWRSASNVLGGQRVGPYSHAEMTANIMNQGLPPEIMPQSSSSVSSFRRIVNSLEAPTQEAPTQVNLKAFDDALQRGQTHLNAQADFSARRQADALADASDQYFRRMDRSAQQAARQVSETTASGPSAFATTASRPSAFETTARGSSGFGEQPRF